MQIRGLLARALLGGAALLLMGHSPYRQWAVYRETHLVVVADDAAPGALAVTEGVAHCLAIHVPGSRAVAARARTAVEVMKLLRSRQLPVGLVLGADAADALMARGSFAGEAPLPLRALAIFGPYLLVALEDFPAGKAREIARALTEYPPPGAPAPVAAPLVPLHPGAAHARGAAAQSGD
jgi:hypothetical protein